MIGDFIPEGDSNWEVFLLLRDVVECLFRPAVTEASTYVLWNLIEKHHQSFLEVSCLQQMSFRHDKNVYGKYQMM